MPVRAVSMSNASCAADGTPSCSFIQTQVMRALDDATPLVSWERRYQDIPSRRLPIIDASLLGTASSVHCLMRALGGRPFIVRTGTRWPILNDLDELHNLRSKAAATALIKSLGLDREDVSDFYALAAGKPRGADAAAALRTLLGGGTAVGDDGNPMTHETTKAQVAKALPRLLRSKEVSYGCLPVPPAAWSSLVHRGAVPWPLMFDGGGWQWADACLGTEDERRRFSASVRRRAILVGPAGAGIGNHTDALPTANWYAQLSGDKRWHLCGRLAVDQSDEDRLRTSKTEAKEECFEGVVQPGEILFHGAGWWHETEGLHARTITLTTSGADMWHGVSALADTLTVCDQLQKGSNDHVLCNKLRRCHLGR